MEKIFFVMPAYNEAENIVDTIKQWYPVVEHINNKENCEAYLTICDDGSKDNTFQIMQQLKNTENLQYFTPLTKTNSGHGATVLFLYRHAIDNGACYIFQTDSDGQTDPNEFWQMFYDRYNYDMQIGHRNNREDGISRVIVTNVLKLVVFMMFHEWVIDANTPFRLMKTEKLMAVMQVIPENYFLCNVAISAIAQKWNYKMQFPKITFRPRQGGVNSINFKRIFKIGWEALGDFRKINANLGKKCNK